MRTFCTFPNAFIRLLLISPSSDRMLTKGRGKLHEDPFPKEIQKLINFYSILFCITEFPKCSQSRREPLFHI